MKGEDAFIEFMRQRAVLTEARERVSERQAHEREVALAKARVEAAAPVMLTALRSLLPRLSGPDFDMVDQAIKAATEDAYGQPGLQ